MEIIQKVTLSRLFKRSSSSDGNKIIYSSSSSYHLTSSPTIASCPLISKHIHMHINLWFKKNYLLLIKLVAMNSKCIPLITSSSVVMVRRNKLSVPDKHLFYHLAKQSKLFSNAQVIMYYDINCALKIVSVVGDTHFFPFHSLNRPSSY